MNGNRERNCLKIEWNSHLNPGYKKNFHAYKHQTQLEIKSN